MSGAITVKIVLTRVARVMARVFYVFFVKQIEIKRNVPYNRIRGIRILLILSSPFTVNHTTKILMLKLASL